MHLFPVLLLDFQATLETKPEKAIKLEKDALAQIETITVDNARLVSNLHANLGGLYRMNGHPDLAREHMEKSISLLDQFNLLHIKVLSKGKPNENCVLDNDITLEDAYIYLTNS